MPHGAGQFAAGWYLAHDDPTKVRYWDGHRWTEHVAVRDPLLTPDGQASPLPGSELEPGNASPTIPVPGPAGPVGRRSRMLAIALLTTPVLGFFLPVIGPAISAMTASFAVRRAGPLLWTGGGWPHARLSAALVGFAALWLLPLVNILALLTLSEHIHLQYLPGYASWLFLPLAGPAQPWTPATVALIVYAGGAALSAWGRRPWPWVAGGVAASLAYDLTIVVADIRWIS